MVFQRPAIVPNGLNISQNDILQKELINYLCSRLYAEKTVKDTHTNQNYKIYPSGLPNIGSKADIGNTNQINHEAQNLQTKNLPQFKNSQATSLNDILRLKYPIDLLIELSPMGGNPIGPYGDINGNYKNVMSSNMYAVKELLEYGLVAEMIANECAKVFTKYGHTSQDSDGENYRLSTHLLDFIYLEFMQKAKLMKKCNNHNKTSDNDKFEKSAEL